MSCVIGNGCSSGVFVMVDRRVGVRVEGSGYLYQDAGGKIAWTGSGWAAITGSGNGSAAVLKALRDEFPRRGDIEDPADRALAVVRGALQEGGYQLEPTFDGQQRPSIPGQGCRESSLVVLAQQGPRIEGAETACLLLFDGGTRSAARHVVTPPPWDREFGEPWREETDQAFRGLDPATPLVERIRRAAGLMAIAAAESEAVSSTVEVGYLMNAPRRDGHGLSIQPGFLRGEAAQIAESGATMLQDFTAPTPTKVLKHALKMTRPSTGEEWYEFGFD